jgi:hypothetical protein
MTIRFLSSSHPCVCGGRVHYPTDSLTLDVGDERITVALYDAPWCDTCGEVMNRECYRTTEVRP